MHERRMMTAARAMLSALLALLVSGCFLIADQDVQFGRTLTQPLPDAFSLRVYMISETEAKPAGFDFSGTRSGSIYQLRQTGVAPGKAIEGPLSFSTAADGWLLYQLGWNVPRIFGLAKLSGSTLTMHATTPGLGKPIADVQRETGSLRRVYAYESNWRFPDRESVEQLVALVVAGKAPRPAPQVVGYVAQPGQPLPDRLVFDGTGWRPAGPSDMPSAPAPRAPPAPAPDRDDRPAANWEGSEKRDRFDDRRIIQFWTDAYEVSGSRKARIYLACGLSSFRPRDPDVVIDFETPMAVKPFGNRNLLSIVQLRFDDRPSGRYAWTVSDSRTQLMAFPFNERPAAQLEVMLTPYGPDASWTVHQFLERLRVTTRLFVRSMAADGRQLEAAFLVAKSDQQIARIRQSCPG